ncbi:MAG: cadherin domain-containing protein [Fibrobacter sp.]|nr:cadherin domain-containing protein [Fibrobacter sp.]
MTSGTMTLGSNTELAGQLLATKINVGAEFSGDFVYMPFEAPLLKVNPNAFADGAYIENDEWVAINMSLDAESVSPVYFDYCFATNSYNSKFTASNADFNLSGSDENGYHEMPICGVSTGKATISAKSIYLDKPIYLNVKLDTETEVPEIVGLRVYNMVGAMMEECDDNGKNCEQAPEGIFPLTIVDANREPVSEDNAVSLKEDESFIFTDEYFAFSSQYPDVSLAGVNIVSLPENGVLLVGEEPVVAGANVALADLQANLLTFKGDENWYGTTAFSFKIYDTKEAVSKEAYAMTITVTPVNDAPVTNNATVTFGELSHDVTGAVVASDVDVGDKLTYTFDDKFSDEYTEENYNKVTSLYEINPTTGEFSVKSGAVLNYESEDKSLTIRVKVKDDASTTGGAGVDSVYSVVTLEIDDENEMFSYSTSGAFSVPENTVPVDPVGSILLNDPDTENDDFRKDAFVIVSVTDSLGRDVSGQGLFSIKETIPYSQIGNLYVEKELDYESSKSYTVVVRAYDETLKEYSEEISITVHVTDMNEPPQIVDIQDSYNEFEHVAVDHVFGTIQIIDQDADDVQGQFVVTLEELNREPESTIADAAEIFDVTVAENAENSKLYIVLSVKDSVKLNYETLFNAANDTASFEVRIHLTDRSGTSGSNSVYADTKIFVTDVNEAPTIDDATFTPDENVPNGTVIGTVVARDPDTKNVSYSTLTYNVVEGDSVFKMDGANVKVVDNSVLNYEVNPTITIHVRVTDGTFADTATVTINLQNVNEKPELDCIEGDIDCNGPYTIAENSATGTKIQKFSVSDVDAADAGKLVPSIVDKNGSGAEDLFKVEISNDTFYVKVKDEALLDYENVNASYDVILTVTDVQGETSSLERTIKVDDVNEPFELAKVGDFEVAENAVPTAPIGKVVVTDEDTKNETFRNNKSKITSVKDASGNEVENQNFFRLEEIAKSETGSEIGLMVKNALNFENSKTYTVTVRVFDDSVEPEYSKTVEIEVGVDDQNEKPELNCFEGDIDCNGPYIIAENSATGTKIQKFSVSDVDAADAGKLVPSIVDKNGSGAEDLFKVEISNDTFYVKVKDEALLDYENVNASYDVILTVTDVQGETSSLERTIKVKDVNEPFTLDREGSFVVAENVAPDTAIGTVIVHDEDSKNPDFRHNKFEIVSVKDSTGTSIANQNFFDIKEIGGEYSGKGGIYVVNPLDYEQSTKYSITVRVYDADSAAYTKTISFDITLNDVNENPEIIPDSDEDGDDDEEDKCKEKGNCIKDPDDPKKIIVGIEENSATNTEVLSYKVVDQDDGDVDSLTATLTDVNKTGAESLFVASVEPFGDDYKLVVRVKDEKKLDFEMIEESYDVTLTVADEDGLTDTIVRTINVIDINEPFTLDKKGSFVVAENVAPDTAIGTVIVLDEDSKNPDFRHNDYNIVSVVDSAGHSIDNEYFKLDEIGGKYSGTIGFYVIKPLDYEKSSEYTVKVAVFDMSAKDFKDTITITISLQDVNENPEIIPDSDDNGEDDEIDKCKRNDNCVDDSDDPENPGDKNKIVVGIEENSATGTEILSYKVVDQDDGDVDSLTATIEETNGSKVDSLFKVDVEKVGEDNYRVVVTVADSSKLDYENIKHEYDVVITVADEDGLTDTIVRTIKIIDVNENPIIAKQEFDFNENEPAGTEVGKIKSDDLDTAKVFKQNVYTAVAGDTALFNVSKDGVITTTKEFNYEAEPHSYVVVVKVSDKKDPKLFDLDTMVIALNNVPETPEFKNTEFDIDENVPDSTKIGTVVARDPDGRQELTYSLVEKSDYVIVTKSGDILVKDGSLFDYETIHEIKVKVRVTDPDKLHSDTTITIRVNDVNETPVVKDQEFFVDENSKKNTVVGQVEASDLDTAKIFSTLTFELVGESKEFQVTKNGTIKTTKVFDYEADSLYTIKVLVTDGEFTDTAVVKIHVNDLYEKTQVEIIEADNRDSCWSKNGVNKCSVLRDTVYTNLPDMNITWTVNGEPQTPDAEKLHEGVNIIIKTYDDPTMNEPGADTLVVIYSTAAPIVTVSTKVDTVEAENIFTVVEQVDARDTNVYVNDPKKDIRVTVKDTVLGTTESFVVKLNLDTVNVSKKDFTKANDIVESGIALNIKPASEMTYTPVNGTEVKVSYTEKVNGETVTVSYLTDNDGEIKKTAVLTDEGTIDSIEVITVTYVTKVDGKDVSLSYKADAVTGEALLMSTDGGLMTASAAETFTGEGRWDDVGEDSPGSSSSKSGSKSDKGKSDKGKSSSSSKSDKGGSSSGSNSGKSKYTVAGLFSVTYDYEDESGNTVTIAYTADSKGSMVKNAEGNVGYNVSYSYTNPFGNTASQAVFIVIDQVGPVVEILSPVDEEVVYTNSVEVTWTVNGIVQDTLALQGLDKGANGIVRFYCDKAGNCDSSIVYVIMKNAKDVDISVEKPVTKITQDLVDEYYEANPPKKGETFAVSIKNAQTGDEVETLIGGDFGSKVGSEDTPYPGLKGHLGPTLGIDIKVPTYGGSGSGKAILSGLATFDELVGKDGMVNIDGVDAAKARKVTVEEFVKDYCSEEFADSLGTDYSRASLYKTTMYVNVWVYTSLGSFVDYFSFNQDLNDPDYADDAGLLKLYFEMKPDKQGYIHTESGKRFGTGSYVYKTEVEMRSTLQCTLPPVDKQGKDANKVGAKRKVTDNLLKSFGYRRPEKR